jgi:hypothetical protein
VVTTLITWTPKHPLSRTTESITDFWCQKIAKKAYNWPLPRFELESESAELRPQCKTKAGLEHRAKRCWHQRAGAKPVCVCVRVYLSIERERERERRGESWALGESTLCNVTFETLQPFSQSRQLHFILFSFSISSFDYSFPPTIRISFRPSFSVFVLLLCSLFLLPLKNTVSEDVTPCSPAEICSWEWRQYVRPKRRSDSTGLHGGTPQNIILFIVTAVRISDMFPYIIPFSVSCAIFDDALSVSDCNFVESGWLILSQEAILHNARVPA